MMGRTVRRAVDEFARTHCASDDRWCVALSGGADSLALAATAALMRPTIALIVDHGLQSGSASVAATARDQAIALGCVAAQVLCVDVGTIGGPEAAARTARYRALDTARDGATVLVAHTLDDQAETVLLGLGRGSGGRSIAGMRPYDPPWGRPLLGVRRADTRGACEELGLTAWHDPHNLDPRYTRVRLREEVLPLLEEVLGGGVAEALARTATALREDADALDGLTADALAAVRAGTGVAARLDTAGLAPLPTAVRTRVIRRWLLDAGAKDLTDGQLRGLDRLVVDWRGRGGVAVGSSLSRQRLFAERLGSELILRAEPI